MGRKSREGRGHAGPGQVIHLVPAQSLYFAISATFRAFSHYLRGPKPVLDQALSWNETCGTGPDLTCNFWEIISGNFWEIINGLTKLLNPGLKETYWKLVSKARVVISYKQKFFYVYSSSYTKELY